MAGSSPLADLLDRAGKVFSLVGRLGRDFHEDHQRQVGYAGWNHRKAAFEAMNEALGELRGPINNPPSGFALVADQLKKAVDTATEIQKAVRAGGLELADYASLFPQLHQVEFGGADAVKRTRIALEHTPATASSCGLDIDTTPSYALPPSHLIEEATRSVPEIMANVRPQDDSSISIVAASLVKALHTYGHSLAAGHWAIHELIRAQRLTPAEIVTYAPSIGRVVGGTRRWLGGPDDRHMEWVGGGKGTVAIPKGRPAPFDTFRVVATEALWMWWRSLSAARGSDAMNENSSPSTPAEQVGQQSPFQEARERAQKAMENERNYFEAREQEKQRRRPVLNAWNSIYATRPRPESGTLLGPFTPDEWRPFAEAIIAFCDLARAAGFEQMLCAVKGEKDSETIAHGFVIEGFKGNAAALAELLCETAIVSEWLIWFNNDLDGRWLPFPTTFGAIVESSEPTALPSTAAATVGDLKNAVEGGATHAQLENHFGEWALIRAVVGKLRPNIATLPEIIGNGLCDWLLLNYRPSGRALTPDELRRLRLADVAALLDSALNCVEGTGAVQTPTDTMVQKPYSTPAPPVITGFLGGADLVNALGVDPTNRDAFFKQLERKRRKLGDNSWHEVKNPGPNSPRFLYSVASPKVRELAEAYRQPKSD